MTRAKDNAPKVLDRMAHKPALVVVFYQNPDNYPPTFNAVAELQRHFHVHIVCRNGDKTWRQWPADVHVERVGPPLSQAELERSSAGSKIRQFAQFVARTRAAFQQVRPALVYAYDPHGLTSAKLAGCRCPLIYHRHEVEDLEHLSFRTMGDWIIRYSLLASPSAAAVVFPERKRAEYYRRFVKDPREPLFVPNFPSRSTFSSPPDLATLVPARLRAPELIYRGSVGPRTGAKEAIEALATLPNVARLRLCGPVTPPPLREALLRRADELGLIHRVDLPGFVPFDVLNSDTPKAAVGLVLYYPDNPNCTHLASATNKLYEYAACALPAVVPDTPSFREFLAAEQWVEYAAQGDPQAIAAAIRRTLSDPDRYAERCRQARQSFESRLNYETAFAPVLQNVLRLTGAPPAAA